jgi:hypothetical protein
MSLIQSAKLNGHGPYRYLKDVLERLPTHPASRIDELLPHRWQPSPIPNSPTPDQVPWVCARWDVQTVTVRVEPFEYLSEMFEQLHVATTVDAIEALLPWNLKPVLNARRKRPEAAPQIAVICPSRRRDRLGHLRFK